MIYWGSTSGISWAWKEFCGFLHIVSSRLNNLSLNCFQFPVRSVPSGFISTDERTNSCRFTSWMASWTGCRAGSASAPSRWAFGNLSLRNRLEEHLVSGQLYATSKPVRLRGRSGSPKLITSDLNNDMKFRFLSQVGVLRQFTRILEVFVGANAQIVQVPPARLFVCSFEYGFLMNKLNKYGLN